MESYYSEYYYLETLVKIYELLVVPMPDKDDWLVPQDVLDEVVLPLKYKWMTGIPKE